MLRVALALLLGNGMATAQSLADLRNDAATPGDVTTYGMGWSQQRYAAGKQIDTKNVDKLVPVWNLSLNHSANASTQPLLIDGVLYRTTIDARVMAMNAKDGKTLWTAKAADYKQGYSLTLAPLVAGGMLITGISGGEYGARGFINGWDLKTGEKKWHRWTIPAPGEKGSETWAPDRYKHRPGPSSLTGT